MNIPGIKPHFLIDSHAHLEMDPLYPQVEQVIGRAIDNDVCGFVTIGIDLEDASRAIEVAERFPCVFAGIGFHPHSAKDVDDKGLAEMERMAAHRKVVGYGEIGLDFFRNWSPRDSQISVFESQIALAKRLNKPVIIHLRDAYSEGLGMLEKAAPFPAGGVIHCFSGNMDDANRALALGFYISVPGPVTYKKNEVLRRIVADLPADRILLETDCPFLSPEPLRGKDNEPAYMVHTAAKVAEVRGVSIGEIAVSTSANAAKLFGLSLERLAEQGR
jgi:TatD DNase family protein